MLLLRENQNIVYMHISLCILENSRGLAYLYIFEGRVGCLQCDRGVAEQEAGAGEDRGGKTESLRRVRALMAPLTTSSVMVSLSL